MANLHYQFNWHIGYFSIAVIKHHHQRYLYVEGKVYMAYGSREDKISSWQRGVAAAMVIGAGS